MAGPLVTHMLLRPVEEDALAADLPSLEDACDVFADAFLCAVLTDQATLTLRVAPLTRQEKTNRILRDTRSRPALWPAAMHPGSASKP
jgi:hypothetical protein